MTQIVYIASPESKQIYSWQLLANGSLTLLQIINTDTQVQPMVISPKKDFLYAGGRPNFCVLSYRIMKNGTLILVDETPLPGSPTYISVDQYRRYLFCSSYNNASISVSPINSNGIPQLCNQIINGIDGCHSANIALNNQLLFVPALKQDCIYLFKFKSNGLLFPYKQIQLKTIKGSGPRHMSFHPNGRYAYSLNELNSSVDVWSINELNGLIKCIQNIDMMPKNFLNTIRWASDIHITPNGKFLYTCDRTSSILTMFSINEDGASLTMKDFQFTEKQPRSFNIDHNGEYLLLAGQKSHRVKVYKIQEHGVLMELTSYHTGQGPIWVVIHQLD
ncbi:6-phosphogluconolactonase [Pantoea sp. Mhis]|uniref:6-phosphogluconolactonase n=1 Tax=Pantoea sp. Mhis TaxID=2576759 RepID=UPI00135A047B|nr:6-phosphogluconolactonase [Pantoea sp. Mhis]MXP56298.1 6-phosphogluconolactonase [Pantoea sp. Mhis]